MILEDFTYGPKSGNKPKQAVILLHGIGSNGEDLIGLAEYFADSVPDAVFISPNAPQEYEYGGGFGYQWFPLWEKTYKELLYGVREAAETLKNFIKEILQKYSLDYSNIFLLGFSQGCMTALHTALEMEKPCAGVLGYSGGMLKLNPKEKDILSKPPVILIHGQDDEVVPAERSLESKKILEELEVKTEVHILPSLTHSIDIRGIEIGKEFLRKHSSNKPSLETPPFP